MTKNNTERERGSEPRKTHKTFVRITKNADEYYMELYVCESDESVLTTFMHVVLSVFSITD